MKNNLKAPCNECPFRKNAPKGWLGGLSAKETSDLVLGEANFACHKTRHKKLDEMSRCKGSQLFLINHCKAPKFNKPLAEAINETKKEKHILENYLGFDFLTHHEIKKV